MNRVSAMKLAKEYQKAEMKEEKQKIVLIGKMIINEINNGVMMEDGRVRKFDIVDLLLKCPIDVEILFYIIRDSLTADEVRAFRKIQQDNLNDDNAISLKRLYESKHIFGVKRDEYGNSIEGTGREVTREEKENIINYMMANKLPLVKAVYDALLDRWINDFIQMPTMFNLEQNTLKR